MRRLFALLVLVPALGEEVRDFKVEAEGSKVRVRGACSLPDRAILTVSLIHQRSSARGSQWRMFRTLEAPVQRGELDRTVALPGGLPFGLYRAEVELDRAHQYPGVEIPPGGVRSAVTFKVPFTEDIAASLRAYLADLEELGALWQELEAQYAPLSARLREPEAIQAWKAKQGPWRVRMSAASRRLEPREELVYPNLRQALCAASARIGHFRDDHESMILEGRPSRMRQDNPEYFARTPAADLAGVPSFMAEDFVFNVGKKVVEYGYDRATELLEKPVDARWGRFRDAFGQDLDRMESACSDLLAGPCKADLKEMAPGVRALLGTGRDLLAAGDLMAEDPTKGAAALAAVKEPMKRAFLAVQEGIRALQARFMTREKPP